MSFNQADWDAWEAAFPEVGNVARQAAASGQPVTINITLNVDNSINTQTIISDGRASARIVDARHRLGKYLPSNYQPTNMDEVEQRLLAPLTKEEKAGLGPWQCFGT